ncbi:aminodeoxychorismate synthase component I [Actinocorallia sp. API 0066]|uniref:aminodeoxychorismate synthase component I n=1 Tax=Actinocorallia sp. API 0066 TaxID=2896846 RepID=UPI001E48CEEE|nr:aminodeoxychorismate synthase component I [Actinocorallia sp. API 0066]MCD0452106.1 aminodeoxychorismate synthase component I [Actinocorallia sp. API 0066]
MRTLLVDNYDSYTYNLFQLIAQINGAEPVVVRNDDPVLGDDAFIARFDNVVISPGPGHPGHRRDFGDTARLLSMPDLPVLGVCLGHQGIALFHGARVRPAGEPRHGHLSRVTHLNKDVFEGLPQNFTGVRYHSLAVDSLDSTSLEAIAWAEDGEIMGVRHTGRPHWGVQFHPESVATEHGARILENFRDLTRRRGAAHRSPSAASPDGEGSLVVRTSTLEREVDAETVYVGLYGNSSHSFWLDSNRCERGLARFSYLGDASGPLSEVLSYSVTDDAVVVESADGVQSLVEGNIFDLLSRRLAASRVELDLPFDFNGGYVGYFGYEMKEHCGFVNRHKAETPDATWMRADRIIVVDHVEHRTYLVALCRPGAESVAEADAWLARTASAVGALEKAAPVPAAPGPSPGVDVPASFVRDRETYLSDIAECLRKLREGESYEVCLTNMLRTAAPDDDLAFYLRMRRTNPAPYSAFLRFGELRILSSSPERFLRIDRHRMVESKPIKGTAARSEDPATDESRRLELTRSAKTRAENLMIVDLVRNDLGQVCEVGSVHVPKFMATESYSSVHQLVSTIRGRLRPTASAVDCVKACFPGGSMTGAPKLRTVEITDRLESEARGVYSGALGYFGFNGSADLSIVIRTAVFWRDAVLIGAGGAIVLDSDPVEEYEEMLLKARAVLLDPDRQRR